MCTMVSGFSELARYTLGSALQPNSLLTHNAGSYRPLWKQWNSGGTTWWVKLLRSSLGATTSDPNSSRQPKCTPKCKSGGGVLVGSELVYRAPARQHEHAGWHIQVAQRWVWLLNAYTTTTGNLVLAKVLDRRFRSWSGVEPNWRQTGGPGGQPTWTVLSDTVQ